MDESQRRDAVARRLALALSLCCVTTTTFAETGQDSSNTTSLRSLLAENGLPRTLPFTSKLPEPIKEQLDHAQLGERQSSVSDSQQRTVIDSTTLMPLDEATTLGGQPAEPSRRPSFAELLRHKRPIENLSVSTRSLPVAETATGDLPLPVLPKTIGQAPHASIRSFDSATSKSSVSNHEHLSDLLRDHRARHPLDAADSQSLAVEKQSAVESDRVHAEPAGQQRFLPPSRTPLPTWSQQPSTESVPPSAESVPPSAVSIIKELPAPKALPTDLNRAADLSLGETSDQSSEATAPFASRVPEIANVPPRIKQVPKLAAPVNSVTALPDREPEIPEAPLKSEGLTEMEQPQSGQETQPLFDATVSNELSDPPSLFSLSEEETRKARTQFHSAESLSVVQSEPMFVEELEGPGVLMPEMISSDQSFSAHSLGSQDFASITADEPGKLFPVPSFEAVPTMVSPAPRTPPTPSVTLHTTRLQELAQHSLYKSQQSLERGATHTARKYAMKAMQAVVALRDAQEGGNQHSVELDAALDAIRESRDFCGEFGMIDETSLRRMVDVHETAVLKQADLSSFTALEATEAYLEHAKRQLAQAAGGVREGAQALALMGQTDFQLAKPVDTHAISAAVAVQRAAIESDPEFAAGYRVLGTTLMQLGLVEEAANCFITSLHLQPSRLAYERLLQAARKLGDVDTASICMNALNDPRMDEGVPVHNLTPTEFASTHRPTAVAANGTGTTTNRRAAEATSNSPMRVGLRTLFPFTRR